MKIKFTIEYKTEWKEELRVILTKVMAEGGLGQKEYPLETYDGTQWEGEVSFPMTGVKSIEYKYALYRDGELVWTEWEVAPHRIELDGKTTNYILTDLWRPIPEDLPLYSSAFTECVGWHNEEKLNKAYKQTLQMRVVEPRLRSGQWLAVVGNSPQLGEWERPVRMSRIALQEWAINLDASMLYNELEYKFVIVDEDGSVIKWEDGMNRRVRSPKMQDGQMWIKTDHRPRLNLPHWKCAGVVIPVFSLRTSRSYGVGDFGDLKEMVKWAVRTDMHAIQILPINDTTMNGTWMDSYPYNSISIYAFHPMYCDLSALPRLKDKLSMEKFLMQQQELNSLPQIDYERVNKLKLEYLRMAYAQEGADEMATDGFKTFFKENSDWLVPYAAYSHLRDTFGTPDFTQWPKHSVYNKSQITRLCSPKGKEYEQVAFYYYVQYKLHLQLLDACQTARKNGVVIKGDIPIGISRTSVEAWTDPHLFNLDGQAGAPPDDFSVNGQNWGFPTYNWEVMAQDGYKWWQRRFKKMSEYFDAYRIDHVLGFFRIWEIPMHSVHGLLGQFSPSLPLSAIDIQAFGFDFDAVTMTRPYITDEVIEAVFGYKKELVKLLYLNPAFDGRYTLKSEFDTQRKIEAAFAAKADDEDSRNLRDGLYSLVSDVLFVRDRKDENLYHPRIAAQHTFSYNNLSNQKKEAFNRLYNDYYYRRHNQFWYREAMKKLPALTQATRMLVCAEDLGMVPDSVQWVMNNLRMLSLEIQTMPKQLGLEFGLPQNNPYRSVATISTHDMPPMRLWWEEDYGRTQKFYNNALYNDGIAPKVLPAWLAEDIISRHLFSPSALCLLSLQDWLSMDETLRHPNPEDERINIPSNPRHYWRYRMHLTIEQLLSATDFNDKVKELIGNSGRA